jgi:uncharacterized Zn finger protein (UPF0148 family)
MKVMTCKNCNTPNINKTTALDWSIALCPFCGADLKKQLEKEKERKNGKTKRN